MKTVSAPFSVAFAFGIALRIGLPYKARPA